jgi:hypothetical protein
VMERLKPMDAQFVDAAATVAVAARSADSRIIVAVGSAATGPWSRT